jgi:hypothetical protein
MIGFNKASRIQLFVSGLLVVLLASFELKADESLVTLANSPEGAIESVYQHLSTTNYTPSGTTQPQQVTLSAVNFFSGDDYGTIVTQHYPDGSIVFTGGYGVIYEGISEPGGLAGVPQLLADDGFDIYLIDSEGNPYPIQTGGGEQALVQGDAGSLFGIGDSLGVLIDAAIAVIATALMIAIVFCAWLLGRRVLGGTTGSDEDREAVSVMHAGQDMGMYADYAYADFTDGAQAAALEHIEQHRRI